MNTESFPKKMRVILAFGLFCSPIHFAIALRCNHSSASKTESSPPLHRPNPHSALLATISFESRKTAPIYLETVVNNNLDEGMLRVGEKGAEAKKRTLLSEEYENYVEEAENEGMREEEGEMEVNMAMVGRICMTVEPKRHVFAEWANGAGRADEVLSDRNGTLQSRPNDDAEAGETLRMATIEPRAFLQCMAFEEAEAKEFGLDSGRQMGTWTLGRCPEGRSFDALQQKCVPGMASVEVANCGGAEAEEQGEPSAPMLHFGTAEGKWAEGCYARCTAEEANALAMPSPGEGCAWLGAPLQADLAWPDKFLQCSTNGPGDPCGKWVALSCPPDTMFNTAAQLCVRHLAERELCPQGNVPISTCANGDTCPGRDTFCHQGANCCVPLMGDNSVEVVLPLLMVQNFPSVCFGTGAYPLHPCSFGCPRRYACQPNIGCCPMDKQHMDWGASSAEDDYDFVSYLVCPGTDNVRPTGSCWSCPRGRYCVPRLRGCCPRRMVVDLESAVLSSEQVDDDQWPCSCPSGEGCGPRCGGYGPRGGCASGQGCYQGRCCSMECPAGYRATGFCRQMRSRAVANPPAAIFPSASPLCAGEASCLSGVCCQMVAPVAQLPVCSNGQVARVACVGVRQCANGFECSNGGCCPIPYCPSGVQAVGRCHGGVSCPVGSICLEALCCPLPVCPSGALANQFCGIGGLSATAASACLRGYECVNHGCCPLPTAICPEGIVPLGRCAASSPPCSVDSACIRGYCCPLPLCPGPSLLPASSFCSVPAIASTSALFSGCPVGYDCVGGGCCPLASCPGGTLAFGSCTIGGCSPGLTCTGGLCCAPSMCPPQFGAVPPSSFCAPTGPFCSPGFECLNGGCCPLPINVCPSGLLPVQSCAQGVCPNGYGCHSGFCCPPAPLTRFVPLPVIAIPAPIPVPTCSLSGSSPMSLCGVGNTCPQDYFCENYRCCQEPLPLCPFGGRAIRACSRGLECPLGYGCTALGGCCPLLVPRVRQQSMCPYSLYPVCQCANRICPVGASCNSGICCAPSVAASFYTPGMRCRRSTDCQGAVVGYARCIHNICVCVNGAYSNGVQCVVPNARLLREARDSCDEFGNGCRVHLLSHRKRAMFAPEIQEGNGEKERKSPLWFNPTGVGGRRCLDASKVKEEQRMELGDQFDVDSTCLPNEKCINGNCKIRLWPGQRGCTSNVECSSRCSNTYCEFAKSENNNNGTESAAGQCLCHNGALLFGRCVSRCPEGSRSVGHECELIEEEAFWGNGTAIAKLKEELSGRSC